jgi:hypothetical protein
MKMKYIKEIMEFITAVLEIYNNKKEPLRNYDGTLNCKKFRLEEKQLCELEVLAICVNKRLKEIEKIRSQIKKS